MLTRVRQCYLVLLVIEMTYKIIGLARLFRFESGYGQVAFFFLRQRISSLTQSQADIKLETFT